VIHPDPTWTYRPGRPAPHWEANVHLLPERIVGVLNARTWFCLDRTTGTELWKRRLGRPNRLCGLAGDVIVATEHRCNDGPWAAHFGIYGISLSEGRLLWTSHAPGGWRRFTRVLDYIPDFTNELRDRPQEVVDGEVLTISGRRLDPETGADTGRHEIEEGVSHVFSPFKTRLLFSKELPLTELGTLVLGRPGEPEEPGKVGTAPLRFHLRGPAGDVRWTFEADQDDRFGDPHYWALSFDYCHPFVYFAARDRSWKLEAGGAQNRFLALDIRSGEFVQDLPLGPDPLEWCHVEACDAESVLIGARDLAGDYALHHHPRQSRSTADTRRHGGP
jgi:hypothetical protein